LRFLILLVWSGLVLSGVSAQNAAQLTVGDPPVATLISISVPDTDGVVIISGAPGAVFPGAQLAIRNLYTEDTVYAQAGVTGSFSAQIYGPGNTPFWISPASNIPNTLRNKPGSLPGGPGTIIFGQFPQIAQSAGAFTQLLVDGDLSDWAAYTNTRLLTFGENDILGLLNQDSLYVAISGSASFGDFDHLQLTFTLEGSVYVLTLDPRTEQLALLQRLEPSPRDLGSLPVAMAQGDAIELRIPLSPINPSNPGVEAASLNHFHFFDAAGTDILAQLIEQDVPLISETDGIVHLNSRLDNDFTRFTISGPVAQGASRWSARGRINTLAAQPGETLELEMDVTLTAPDVSPGLIGLRMLGEITLQPVTGADSQQLGGGLGSNNGWSNLQTPGGLAIDNLHADIPLAQTVVPWQAVIRKDGQFLFPMQFSLTIPEDLPPGLYVPVLRGSAQVSDGDVVDWTANGLFGAGSGISRLQLTRLPLLFNLGGNVEGNHLVWALFLDSPSNGSRGILSEEDRAKYALDNRVRYNSPTYILQPFDGTPSQGKIHTYPLEPYLLNLLPNAYDSVAAPLIPFLFPGGRLNARVTRPDGIVDDLGSLPILQNQLSTVAVDERALFGGQSPVDSYRLTTLNDLMTNFTFDQYGPYTIDLTGSAEDIWGNRYTGGGTYRVLVAEMLDILPGVLSGTPFRVGDAFYPGLRVSPGVPADVTVNVTIYPLDDSPVLTYSFSGQADQYGHFFSAEEPLYLDTPGEYVADYEVRYTDSQARLWAGSLRSAGVIASQNSTQIAHGMRGLDDDPTDIRPAWLTIQQHLARVEVDTARLQIPYFGGDVAWLDSGVAGQIKPSLTVQDTSGGYADWLVANYPDFSAIDDATMQRLAVEDELPVAMFNAPASAYSPSLTPDAIENTAYSYISMVRPGLTARQFVQGGYDGGLLTHLDADDPYNQQSGAGLAGDRPGDFWFVFGGTVVKNDAANVRDAAIYGAFVSLVNSDDALGERISPPFQGASGGPNGGPLLVAGGQEVDMFFHPTGARPGQVFEVGDVVAIAGQVAPTLPSTVTASMTAPDGTVRQAVSGTANPVGYFYMPDASVTLDQPGVWTVQITVRHDGLTSAGMIEPPAPTGGILGVADGRFSFYVLPAGSAPLVSNVTETDVSIGAGIPFNYNFAIPDGWTDFLVYHTVTTPSYILEQGALRTSGRTFSYQYNPTNLSRVFSNLENNGQGSGPSASDVVTLTFVVTGLDEDGMFQIRSRTFTIRHDRMLSLEFIGEQ
jgi:hypothetical protein